MKQNNLINEDILRLGSLAWSQEAELAHFKTTFLSSVIRTRLSNLLQRCLNCFPEIILINSAVFLQARLGDLDMSDDDTVPAAPGQIVEVHSDEVDSQSQDSGEAMQVVSEHQSTEFLTVLCQGG